MGESLWALVTLGAHWLLQRDVLGCVHGRAAAEGEEKGDAVWEGGSEPGAGLLHTLCGETGERGPPLTGTGGEAPGLGLLGLHP